MTGYSDSAKERGHIEFPKWDVGCVVYLDIGCRIALLRVLLRAAQPGKKFGGDTAVGGGRFGLWGANRGGTK